MVWGNQMTRAVRDAADKVAHLGVSGLELCGVVLGAGAVVGAVGRIRQCELVGDDLGVGHDVSGVVPQVRIDFTVDVLAQHGLRQKVGLRTRPAQEAVGGIRGDLLQGGGGNGQCRRCGIEALTLVLQADRAGVQVRGDVHVALVHSMHPVRRCHAHRDSQVLVFDAGGGKPHMVDSRFTKRPGHVGVSICRQGSGILAGVNAVRGVEQGLRRAKRGDHVGRHVTGAIGADHAHVHAVATRGGVAHAQSQPDGVERDIFHQRYERGAAGSGLVSNLGDGHIGGLPHRLHEILWLKQQAVGQQNVCVGNIAHRAQAGLEGMWIFSSWYQGGHMGVWTGHLRSHVREDRGGRYDLQALGVSLAACRHRAARDPKSAAGERAHHAERSEAR